MYARMLGILWLAACHVTTPEPPAAPVAPVIAAPHVTAAPALPAPPVAVPQLAMGANDDIPPDTIHGQVIDAATGDAIAGVTVIVTSPALEHTQTAISDENGEYQVGELPAGTYLATYYYGDITVEKADIVVVDDSASPMFVELDTSPRYYHPPATAQSGVAQWAIIEPNMVWNIPVPGRTFEAALGAAAGSQSDPPTDEAYFTGVTSLENHYFVDGEEVSFSDE